MILQGYDITSTSLRNNLVVLSLQHPSAFVRSRGVLLSMRY